MKIGFLGIGQAGSNICETAELSEYRTAIINTSPEDLDSIKLVSNKLLLGKNGGAGKDRRISKADFKKNYNDVIKFVSDKFSDKDIEIVYVVFSTGGGTGSGLGPIVIDILKNFYPQKKFGAVAILPALNESMVAQVNSIECLKELLQLKVPTFIIDNDKYSQYNKGYSKKDLYDTINEEFIDDLNLILNTERKSSKYGNIDNKDIMKILTTPGAIEIGVSDLSNNKDIPFAKKVIQSFDQSVYARMELDGIVKKLGYIFETKADTTKDIKFDELYTDIGTPLEVFEGYYLSEKEKNESVIVIASGLSFPEGRMKLTTDKISNSKDSLKDEKTYDVLNSTDTSWFLEARDEAQVDTSKQMKEAKVSSIEDIEDLFSRY